MTTDKSSVRILIYNDCGTEKFLNVFFPVYILLVTKLRKRPYKSRFISNSSPVQLPVFQNALHHHLQLLSNTRVLQIVITAFRT